ncbi:hypothetical protein GCM10022223_24810 [Kineosporia mesophila]|uniref:Big-1 domain-containing protein n=1 Tax=Kineosporia mesophila TaxID=566012 RepID=A0ABP6ZH95_9ACTN|nr:hypothetical protein [Kineosporia mesophila]MCD5350632.1 hypothetical protein [Kineosporia mesophila]
MNLQSKKARLPIAALGVTALCTGGVGIFASPAFAATEIALNSGATSIAVGNFGTGTTATANAAYALKIQDTSVSNTVLSVESKPTGGHLAIDKAATNAAAASGGFSTVGTTNTSEVQSLYFSTVPASGYYKVTVGSTTTANITTYTASALASALNTAFASGTDITVTGSGTSGSPFVVTFGGALSGTNEPQMTVDTTTGTLEDSGSTAVTATVGTTTNGSSSGSGTTATTGTIANTDYLYVTGDVPGAYKFRIFQDTNGNSVYDSPDERSTALVTLNVYDTSAATADTSDDVDAVVTATSPSSAGDAISSEITYSKSLSLADARGSGVATGLAGRLGALTWIDVNSTAAGVSTATNQQPVYSTSTNKLTYAVGTPTGAGNIVLKTDLAATSGAASYTGAAPKTITVTSNNVATITSGVTVADGSVKRTANNVAVKAGTGAVEYTATALDSSGTPVPVANAKVTFTLTASAANIAKLSADGTAGATTTTTKSYTATTDAKGVAKLKVTSTDTTSAVSYTVDTTSNGHSGTQLSTAYATATPARIVTTSTTSDLTPTVGTTSVVLKGTVQDQFGGAFSPSSGDPQQVTVQIPDGTQVGFAPLGSAGTFSYTYTPPTSPAPAVGDTTTFDFVYGTVPDVDSEGGTIRWASAAAASKITLTAPLDGAKDVVIQDNTTPVPAQVAAFGNTTGAIAGTVYGADNAVLAYKSVKLGGGNGVLFSTSATPDADHPLVATIDAVTDASGVLGGVYVYFTKAGDHEITATSGTITAKSTVSVAAQAATQGYNVTVDDINGTPGSTLIVTGKVTDLFGNAVPGAVVSLSTGTSTVGALGSSTLTTNAAGVFSTTFVTGSNSSGKVDLTAEIINNPAGTPTANAAYKAAGLVIADGKDTAAGVINVAKAELTLSSSARVTATATGGVAKLSGTSAPNTTVDIYGRASGSLSYTLMDSATTDDKGEWGISIRVMKSTFFLAKANGLSSGATQTQVWSSVSVSAKALGKGKVKLTANGDPNAKATLSFYRSIAGADPLLKQIVSNSTGTGSVTVSLPKGSRSVYVTYKAAGTGLGTSKTLKVNVK